MKLELGILRLARANVCVVLVVLVRANTHIELAVLVRADTD